MPLIFHLTSRIFRCDSCILDLTLWGLLEGSRFLSFPSKRIKMRDSRLSLPELSTLSIPLELRAISSRFLHFYCHSSSLASLLLLSLTSFNSDSSIIHVTSDMSDNLGLQSQFANSFTIQPRLFRGSW